MKWLDTFLDRITMYRLLLYYLIFLLLAAVGLSTFGQLHYSVLDIVASSSFLVAVSWLSNKAFAWAFDAPSNPESSLITGLILALIVSPVHDLNGGLFLAAAGGLAIASKYMVAIRHRHIFNPAAIAVVLTSFGAGDSASWWVGTVAMLPFVLVGGVLLVRRIRRSEMASWNILAAIAVTALIAALSDPNSVIPTLQKLLLNSALFFAAFVMVTEPLTSPSTRQRQAVYAVLVGALFAPQIHIGSLYSTPELALVVGNVFTYLAGPRTKVLLRLKAREQISHDSYDFVFTPDRPFTFTPGQYMEFTLAHPNTDARGARRYFTLASSPTEHELRLGVKFYEPGSSYKKSLLQLGADTPVVAAQLGGDFTLPRDTSKKLVFIAGGIGITPYRSMVKYLLDTGQQRQITMLYSARTSADIVYCDVFEQARTAFGMRSYYLVGDESPVQPPFFKGTIDENMLRSIPGYKDCQFYISGPHGMVVAVETALSRIGVPKRHIKKDFFSGYA